MGQGIKPSSKFGYPDTFTGIAPLAQQMVCLQRACRKLDTDLDIGPALELARSLDPDRPLHEGAEGYAAIIRPGISGEDHLQDVAFALELFGSIDGSYIGESVDPAAFRQSDRTRTMLERLCAAQEGDVLILPVQLGKRYAKRIDETVVSAFGQDSPEFALDVLATVSLLVTHQGRITDFRSLGMSCPGDEYDFLRTGEFGRTLMFMRQAGKLTFRSRPRDYAHSTDHGVVTGFLHAA